MVALASLAVKDIFFASLCADLARKAALHPVDTMAVRLQYDRSRHASTAASRLPLVDDAKAVVGIISAPGAARTLYRGLSTSLIGAVPMSLVYMPTYELVSAALKSAKASGLAMGLPASQLASVATGVACATVRVPVSMIKSRVQLGLAATPWMALRCKFGPCPSCRHSPARPHARVLLCAQRRPAHGSRWALRGALGHGGARHCLRARAVHRS